MCIDPLHHQLTSPSVYPAELPHAPSSADQSALLRLGLQVICLTPLQIEQVLIWREEHLRNMLAIYEQRQHINAEVTRPSMCVLPVHWHFACQLMQLLCFGTWSCLASTSQLACCFVAPDLPSQVYASLLMSMLRQTWHGKHMHKHISAPSGLLIF